VGRYAVITRDTALFKGMSRAVQYGDFLSKAVLYDHLTKVRKVSPAQAQNKVTEEFVNYTLQPSRFRAGAEANGLAWFWTYKLRSIKVAHRMLRDNPLRALMLMNGLPFIPQIPGISIGSPLSDNALNVLIEGRADNALGWGMGQQAIGLNPYINIFN
jgi:hypothetical protein